MEFMVDSCDNRRCFQAQRFNLNRLHFGCHINVSFNNVYKRMKGEIADIRVYDWLLDDIQCQVLRHNYKTQ